MLKPGLNDKRFGKLAVLEHHLEGKAIALLCGEFELNILISLPGFDLEELFVLCIASHHH